MDESTKKYWTDDPELIEKYVLGKISAEEKQRLDLEIADCEPCREKLRNELEIAAGIRRYGRDMLKARLRKRLKRRQAVQFTSYQYIGLAAAVVIIAVGIGVFQIWFSDLVAPTQFRQQQIVLESRKDTAESRIESSPHDERPQETQRENDRIGTPPGRQEETAGGAPSIQSSSSGAVSSRQQAQPPTAAMAEHEASLDEMKSSENTSAIWLTGTVVMISDGSEQRYNSASKMEMSKKSDRQTAKEKSSEAVPAENVVIARRAAAEGIVLQQRPRKDLPAVRSQQRAARREAIETLLEKNEKGISLTLFDDGIKDSDLNAAVVETFSEDSLVVLLPNQRIAYRLPAGWNTHSRGRR